MNMALAKAWTQQDFLDWEGHGEGRFEFDGVRPVAMTGGSANHNRITLNVHAAVRVGLRGGPCELLGLDAGVQTAGDAVRYPDALITCSRADGDARLIPGVVIVFEVVSPSSIRLDHYIKFREYAAVETIRRYVIVESGFAGVTVHERPDAATHWITTVLTIEDALHLPEVGIEIAVAALYAEVTLATTDKQAAP